MTDVTARPTARERQAAELNRLHTVEELQETMRQEIDRLRRSNAALVKALQEALCWIGPGRPMDKGAKCETQADMIDQAIAATEGEENG